MPSHSALSRPPYATLRHEREARKRANRIELDAHYIVAKASVSRAQDPRFTLDHYAFGAFADYTEGWSKGCKDRLWVVVRGLLSESGEGGSGHAA